MQVLCGYMDLNTRICGSTTRIYAGIVTTLVQGWTWFNVGKVVQQDSGTVQWLGAVWVVPFLLLWYRSGLPFY